MKNWPKYWIFHSSISLAGSTRIRIWSRLLSIRIQIQVKNRRQLQNFCGKFGF